jgi:hypothetical protein
MKPGGLRKARSRWPIGFGLVALVLVWLAAGAPAAGTTNAARTVGIETPVALDLPRADYQPRPLDDRTEMILRLGAVTPAANGRHHYELFFMGLEPGRYRLADFMVRSDGSRPDELSNVEFEVHSLLPADHDGQLTGYVPRPFPFLGGYRALLAALGMLWAGGIAAFVVSYRKKRGPVEMPTVVATPSFAERLRPLVEAAAAGTLSPDGKAQLERLLLAFWRDKLQLPDQRMADALARLREHTEAGILLRALEHWLHQRGGASPTEVTALLAPYRQPAAPPPAKGTAP